MSMTLVRKWQEVNIRQNQIPTRSNLSTDHWPHLLPPLLRTPANPTQLHGFLSHDLKPHRLIGMLDQVWVILFKTPEPGGTIT